MTDTTDLLEPILAGPFRRRFVDEALARGGMGPALRHLRAAMRAHGFRAGGESYVLKDVVDRMDRRTRSEGFRVLHSWDFRELEFSRESTPVILLDYFADIGMVEGTEREALAILLDYYFFHLLILCAMRAWDAEDPVAYLERVDGLVRLLQGPDGSGHRFVEHAETLLVLGVSQFHPEEAAYERLIEKVWGLEAPDRRARFATLGTAVLAGHLRWGFGVMYRRDIGRMRDDNVGDYPWLITSVLELLHAYDRSVTEGAPEADRLQIAEAIVNGLTPDPWAFFEKAPRALADYATQVGEVRDVFARHEAALLADFERVRPDPARYSPLHLHFNFPHNALVAKVLIALHRGSELNLPIDALWRSPDPLDADQTRMTADFASTLMNYSGVNPEGYDQHGAMFVVHDAKAGLRHYNMALSVMRKSRRAAESAG